MDEEEKKPEQGKETEAEKPQAKEEENEVAKAQDGKKGGGGGGEGQMKEGGSEEKKGEAPPAPEEIMMRVFMHCEGCARKVRRCLKGFEGVEDVKTDCKAREVVVKGKKAAEDPMKVVERIQRKAGRKVELLTPLPPPKPEKKEVEKKEEEKPKVEEKKSEPQVIAIVLKVHMHCEACAEEMKRTIMKKKGFSAFGSHLNAFAIVVCMQKLSSVLSSLLKFLLFPFFFFDLGGGSGGRTGSEGFPSNGEGRLRPVEAGGVRVQADREAGSGGEAGTGGEEDGGREGPRQRLGRVEIREESWRSRRRQCRRREEGREGWEGRVGTATAESLF